MIGYGTILEIGLTKSYRSGGRGKKLARYAEEKMKKMNVAGCYVSAYGPAQEFWLHCGYAFNGAAANNGLPIMVKKF